MIRGQYHDYHHVGLPQFTDPKPENVNELTGLHEIKKETHNIVFTTDPNRDVHDEFKDFEMDFDDTIGIPLYAR